MSHYVYAMYVSVVSFANARAGRMTVTFVPHYKKAAFCVQQLEISPRIPYMVCFTMPTRAGDPATSALYHLSLLKPSQPCAGDCKDVEHVHQHVFSPSPILKSPLLHGHARPCGQARSVRGQDRYTEAWRAWEALTLSRAEHGWAKLMQQGRVPILNDVALFRSWYLPDSEPQTLIQSVLLPWLQGSFRHVYRGPSTAPQHATQARPKYTVRMIRQKHPEGLACLPSLSLRVALEILRMVGYVYTEEGTQVIVADTAEAKNAAVAHAPPA